MVTPRTICLFVMLLFGIGAIGYGYYSTEYITNKGPDDLGIQSYVAAYLTEKYGALEKGNSLCIQITDFKPDQPRGKKGQYTIACTYKGQHLTVQAYYADGKFYGWKDFPSISK